MIGRVATWSAVVLLAWPVGLPALQAPGRAPGASTTAERAAKRIAALQREADNLALQERTVLRELRALEVERDLRAAEARRLDGEIERVSREIDTTTTMIARTETEIDSARPLLHARLVEVYKLGGPGYARVLLGVGDLREMGRAARMVSALARLDQARVAEFVASRTRLTAARTVQRQQAAELGALRAAARQAADRAAAAATARADLASSIDRRRDLNAQLVHELEAIRQRLQQALGGATGGAPDAEAERLPLAAFRGALDWPVTGRVVSRFGPEVHPRFGTTVVRHGIEIAAPEGTPIRAVHEGRVVFADVFTGFGQLVIVDHGGLAFSLYGHLASMAARPGDPVTAGQEIGTTGRTPAGTAAVYFELRIDAKPVDPLQWLQTRAPIP